MTDGEICREYRLAKDKDKQIGIIADQCGMDKDEIIKVLVDCGEMEPLEDKRKELDKQMEQLRTEFDEIWTFLKWYGQEVDR